MKSKIYYIIFLISFSIYAQQDAQFTQYMFNTINVNPAYAGSRGVMSIFGMHRTQWVGVYGAPVTNVISLHTPINNSKLGIGATLINDRIGPTHENDISVDVSYTVQASENYKLSFGVKGTANFFNLDVNRLTYDKTTFDEGLVSFNEFSPNIGAGVYLHSNKSYIGFSVPNFLESNRYEDNDVAIFKERVNYYLIAGHVFDLSSNTKFKPALLTKLVEGAPLQVDVSGNFMYNDKFVLGVAYRWDAAVSALAGFQVNDSMYIGYGYDLETTSLRRHNSGSHEIFLRYELFKNYNNIVSPRFF